MSSYEYSRILSGVLEGNYRCESYYNLGVDLYLDYPVTIPTSLAEGFIYTDSLHT